VNIAHCYRMIHAHGGVCEYIAALAALQRAAGHRVFFFESVATLPPAGAAAAMLVADAAELHAACRRLGIDILHHHGSLLAAAPAGLPVVCTVHEHSPHCLSGGLFLKRRGLPCPRVYSPLGCAQGHLRDHCGSLRPARLIANLRRLRAQRRLLPGVRVICVGAFLKGRMVKSGYDPAAIEVIGNFAAIAPGREPVRVAPVPAFLFLGRLEKSKGVAWLLRAFAAVPGAAVLNIAGEGAEAARLRALAGALGIAGRVRFLGWVAGDAKRELLLDARALIVPSLWHETFGLVAAEAAALSRPVISSDAGELPYLIGDGVNGLVVPAGDMAALARAIGRLAVERETARDMGFENHLRYRRCFTPEEHLRRIELVYAGELGRC
jgi:glycosyltransferase involved in cell wall biosynthesis